MSHTKDGFKWEEHEDILLELLKTELETQPIPLLAQAEGHRSRVKPEDLRSGADIATRRTAASFHHDVPEILRHQITDDPDVSDPPTVLSVASFAARREIELQYENDLWQIELEITDDPSVGEWVGLSYQPSRAVGPDAQAIRRVGIRMACAHPFMERFGGTEPAQLEPLLRVAVAIVLAETTARDSGVKLAGTMRRNINELLRDGLSHP